MRKLRSEAMPSLVEVLGISGLIRRIAYQH